MQSLRSEMHLLIQLEQAMCYSSQVNKHGKRWQEGDGAMPVYNCAACASAAAEACPAACAGLQVGTGHKSDISIRLSVSWHDGHGVQYSACNWLTVSGRASHVVLIKVVAFV